MATFARNLKDARRRKFRTAAEFARAINLSGGRIRNWERGYAWPEARRLIEISHILQVDLYTLFPGAYKGDPEKVDTGQKAA